MDERRLGLNKYLGFLVSCKHVAESHEVHIFLTTNKICKEPPAFTSGDDVEAVDLLAEDESYDKAKRTVEDAISHDRAGTEKEPFFASAASIKPAIWETKLFSLLEEIFEVESLGVVRRGTLSFLKKVSWALPAFGESDNQSSNG